jgi:hypothetical protein
LFIIIALELASVYLPPMVHADAELELIYRIKAQFKQLCLAQQLRS